MTRDRLLIFMLVVLGIGFGLGFVFRPIIMPPTHTTIANSPPPPAIATAAPRGTQYFETNIGKARQVAAGCREGTIHGEECTNAEAAIVTFESRKRFKRFRTDQR